jgi:hypothetical protein
MDSLPASLVALFASELRRHLAVSCSPGLCFVDQNAIRDAANRFGMAMPHVDPSLESRVKSSTQIGARV